MIFSFKPLIIGMRWYWRDFESMDRWSRSDPHKTWWQNFLRDSGGTGFWHEPYAMRGSIEAIYDDVGCPLGLSSFAPTLPARGKAFSSRGRLGVSGDVAAPPQGTSESEIY